MAVAWDKARFLAEPGRYEARFIAIKATSTEVGKVDGEKKERTADKQIWPRHFS